MASGDTLLVLRPRANDPPAASDARIDTRNRHFVLTFATGESAVFGHVLPRRYAGGGLTAHVHYAMASAVANNVKWDGAFERIGDGVQDLDADSFAAAQTTGDVVVPATSGLVDIAAIVFTDGAQLDGLLVGEAFRFKLTRATPTGTDATGDAQLVAIELKET